mmetsp:Transcript_219/g.400  ORF Transcript_219/g.400 Transcript_219/m.400 type:complete len:186 (-) Transcript_219:280-837(-)
MFDNIISFMVNLTFLSAYINKPTAAGFGGKLISTMIRTLTYDYRHYGAGLPDLLLVRAFTEEESLKVPLDLSKWVGEVFHEHLMNNASILIDRDEEFIGGSIHEKQKLSPGIEKQQKTQDSIINIPERLMLSYENKSVDVQCLFVEVKSANDKLDERQEDWLNVLDRFGHARICKFNNAPKKKKK